MVDGWMGRWMDGWMGGVDGWGLDEKMPYWWLKLKAYRIAVVVRVLVRLPIRLPPLASRACWPRIGLTHLLRGSRAVGSSKCHYK